MSAPITLTDQTRIIGGEARSLSFTPAAAGSIFVTSTPPPPSAASETDVLALIQLYRPGNNRPVASVNCIKPKTKVQGPSPTMSLAYAVTAAELAVPGPWRAVVTNAAIAPYDFHTEVTYPGPGEVRTATIDIPFLNIVLAKLFDAAALKGHLQTSSDGSKRSYVSLGRDLASQFGLPPYAYFNVGDATVGSVGYRIQNLDTDPNYPIASIQTSPLRARLTLAVDPSTFQLESSGPVPGVRLGFLSVEISIGFEGSVEVSCSADLHLTFENIDLSGVVSSAIVNGIKGFLHDDPAYAPKFTRQNLRRCIDLFFKSFLRLGSNAGDLSYAVEGDTLKVFYILTEGSTP